MKGDLRCVCLLKVRSMWQEKSRTRPFLKAIVELFAHHHSLTIEEICACFAQFDKAYHCEKMTPGTDFDYAVYFDDAEYDAYYYCVKMEMGHTIYHRFTKEDYQMLID